MILVRARFERTFPPGPQASSDRCRPWSPRWKRQRECRTPVPFSIIQENLPVFGPDTESQSRLKVDEQKRAILGTQEKDRKSVV